MEAQTWDANHYSVMTNKDSMFAKYFTTECVMDQDMQTGSQDGLKNEFLIWQ